MDTEKTEIDTEELESWIYENLADDQTPTFHNTNEKSEDNSEEPDILDRFRGDSTNTGMINDSSRSLNLVIKILLAAILIAAIGMAYIKLRASPVIVVGISMEPTYSDGDLLKTSSVFEPTDIHYDTVICCNKENTMLIKRVVGLPGDKIHFKDGYIYINDKKREDIFPQMKQYPDEAIILGSDEYYVLGDNRNFSKDSRFYGPIKFDEITNIVLSNVTKTKEEYEEIKNAMQMISSMTDASSTDAATESKTDTEN